MKMMDITHDGMMEVAIGGAAALSDAGDSDHSLPSSATSTPGASAFGGSGAGGAAGAGGGAGGRGGSGGPGSVTNASHAGSGSGGSKPRVQLPASCDPPLPDTPTKPLVWIVFGGTGHMGRSLVKCALAHGDYVTTVGRTHETSPAAMQALAASEAEYNPVGEESPPAAASAAAAAAAAAANRKQRCLGALCDVRARESVDRVVRRTLAQFGRIDVVANCSGYGVVGACEDQDEHELRNQFETNFMGTLHILQATLPILRRQQQELEQQQQQQLQQGQQPQNHGGGGGGGRYLIFSSTAGALGVPGLGPYCATKYAVEGLIEAMLYEVDAFNIKATLVEPGLMRRDDHLGAAGDGSGGGGGGGSSTSNREPGAKGGGSGTTNPLPTWGHFLIKPPSEPYAGASSPALHATRMVQWLGDRQPASVVQCAELVWQLAHCSFPPLRLPLGSYAIESIRDRLRSVTEELEDWKHLNFPMPPDAAAAATATTTGGAAAAGGAAADKADKDERNERAAGGGSAVDEHDEEMVDIGS